MREDEMLNARLFALAIAICCWESTQATGQALAPNGNTKAAAWKPSRLPDGHPDLQGYWTNNTATPLQRPAGAGEFLTADEVNARAGGQAAQNRNNPFPNLFGITAGDAKYVMRRTSIITDPPDGKIPPLTPEAQRKYEADREYHRLHYHDGPEEMTTFERCLVVVTSGPPMLPTAYNNNYQIVQTHDHVIIMTEMMHDVRIIPLDGRPHDGIRQWMGDARGHWEGATLVVETTNFNGKRGYFGPLLFNGDDLKRHDEQMRVIERFTRTAPDILLYQFTINDPGTYTKTWSGEIEIQALKGPIIEYACHEGNQAMGLILKGARTEEKAAAEAARKKSQ
jgi:hypothetical protein